MAYYKNVATAIDAGAIVPEAVIGNLQPGIIETNAKDDASPLNTNVLNQLYNDIVSLLTI
ncbi:MAG: hypothetical protein IPL65_04255 [Lewinellaceae bacterium]|nr:hypothetical protein [Lewinellaceae bacterium]